MRVLEVARLRVKDVEFARKEILVRNGKGHKDRVTMLPLALVNPLREHLKRVKALHDNELAAGFGAVYLPLALEKKYPNGAKEWMWQYVFPASKRSVDPRSGEKRRPHVQDQAILRAIKQAARDANLTKPATPHTLRHYLPFLTMSCDFDQPWRSRGNNGSQRRMEQSITRHSFGCPTDYSGSRGADLPAYNALVYRAAGTFSPAPSPSSRGSHQGRSAWFPPIHVRATAQ